MPFLDCSDVSPAFRGLLSYAPYDLLRLLPPTQIVLDAECCENREDSAIRTNL